MAGIDDLEKQIPQEEQNDVDNKNNSAEINKISQMISDEEKKINALYTQIGYTYYQMHFESAEPEQTEKVLQIKKLLNCIDDYKDEIRKIKGIIVCPNCGAEMADKFTFCSACGAKIPVPQPKNTGAAKCPNCGWQLSEGQKFCVKCGTKVINTGETANVQVQAPEYKICNNCGKKLSLDSLFCTECGKRL